MADHYTLQSSCQTLKEAPCSMINIAIWSTNRGTYKGTKPMPTTLSSSMHIILDAEDSEVWDQLWLLRQDIELAMEAARPGTFNPLPDSMKDLETSMDGLSKSMTALEIVHMREEQNA